MDKEKEIKKPGRKRRPRRGSKKVKDPQKVMAFILDS